jgi:hypothetical protein
MEVHHHSHSARKKWTHYFWEFLMLFLAVFCGFLAEMKLEHTIEHQREKKYAASLFEDLRKDTIDLTEDIRWWNMQMKHTDTILSELERPSEERDPLRLYKNLSVMRRYNGFEYHDRTIDQLKNAGYFRLFRKQNVANSLMEYDALVRRTLLSIEDGASTLYFNSNLLMNKFTDTRYFHTQVTFNNLDSLYLIRPDVFRLKNNEDEIFEYANHLRYYRGNMVLRNGVMRNLLAQARGLINLVKEEYHLED